MIFLPYIIPRLLGQQRLRLELQLLLILQVQVISCSSSLSSLSSLGIRSNPSGAVLVQVVDY